MYAFPGRVAGLHEGTGNTRRLRLLHHPEEGQVVEEALAGEEDEVVDGPGRDIGKELQRDVALLRLDDGGVGERGVDDHCRHLAPLLLVALLAGGGEVRHPRWERPLRDDDRGKRR
jgi:hypothetical protein